MSVSVSVRGVPIAGRGLRGILGEEAVRRVAISGGRSPGEIRWRAKGN